tara:strand:- start:2104 stop:2241 length:138 start_codon:yes stop_codon:yes gene_type:complete
MIEKLKNFFDNLSNMKTQEEKINNMNTDNIDADIPDNLNTDNLNE